jgi:rare lipoprotein A
MIKFSILTSNPPTPMRTTLLLALSLLTLFVHAQEFRWDNETLPTPAEASIAEDQMGYAIFYADYYEGNPTALGEVYRANEFTAAHATLPLGTMVEVTRLDNGMSTVVRINDRGAYCEGCLIDLSRVAAEEIDLLRDGRTQVKIQILGYAEENPTPQIDESRFVPKHVDPGSAPTRRPAASDRQLGVRTPIAPAGGGTLTPRGTYPAPGAPEVPVRTSAPQGYVVQLGSYTDFSNAQRHVVSLQQKGFNSLSVLQEGQADGSLLHRVIVSPFRSEAEARTYLAELQQYHQITGLVVKLP